MDLITFLTTKQYVEKVMAIYRKRKNAPVLKSCFSFLVL